MARRLTCASLLALAFMRRCRAAQEFGVRLCKKTLVGNIQYCTHPKSGHNCSAQLARLVFFSHYVLTL